MEKGDARHGRKGENKGKGRDERRDRDRPRRGDDDRRGDSRDNAHFERHGAADTVFRRPNKFNIGNGELWVCAENDFLDHNFLRHFPQEPLVITCKDMRVSFVEQACRIANVSQPLLFNIGMKRGRHREFYSNILPAVRDAMDAGRSVIVHCRAGRH